MTAALGGRIVLVTGATGAIGSATARSLATRAAKIIAVARGEPALRHLVDALPGEGHTPLAFDVGEAEAWERYEGRLAAVTDVVCAAAVVEPIGEIGTYRPRDFAATLSVNLLGSLCAVHHCLAGLKAAEGGVVFFSGGGATSPLPRYDAYATSKAAVVRLAENLATVLAPRVRVNAVAPGFVVSAMHDATLRAGPARAGSEYHERTTRQIAAGGFPAEESAELVALLLSEKSAGITGRLISAQWDAWRDPGFFPRLSESPHLATLRRIDDVFFAEVSRS